MLQPGTTLDHDRYRIEAVIGRGGFGYVYRARERLTEETVAIKELVPSFVDDQQMVQRFIQEARATLRLTHPHIARTHTIFEDRGTYYLAMEYLQGGSLADRLKRGPLPVQEAVRIAIDLCDALAYAHREGVVHCDIKPANVLFDERGRVRLADFGIAHVSPDLMTQHVFTASGTAMGTVQYMAPEQLEGVRDDPRVDIYAMGVLLYRMVAGRPYLDFETETSLGAQLRNAQRIQSQPPRPLRAVNPAAPEWLAQVAEQALKKAPQHRFPTVSQLRDALQRGAETRLVPPARPAPPRRSRATQAIEWVRSLPVAAAALGGLAAVALLSCSAMAVWYIIRPALSPQVTPAVTLTPTSSATPPTPVLPTVSHTSPPPETPTDTPPPDRDGDGVPDNLDHCPDQSGSSELSGCPDSDGDGIRDLDDQCPDSSGPAENAGCPAAAPTEPPPTERAAPASPTTSQIPSPEEEAIGVIRQFNADQTAAVRELALSALDSTCTDRFLAEQKRYIDQLIRDNLYEVQEQLGFEVLSIRVSGNEATVVTQETWQTEKHDRDTHECRYHQPAFTTQQTYTLVRKDGVWKIAWDNFDTPAPTDVPGC